MSHPRNTPNWSQIPNLQSNLSEIRAMDPNKQFRSSSAWHSGCTERTEPKFECSIKFWLSTNKLGSPPNWPRNLPIFYFILSLELTTYSSAFRMDTKHGGACFVVEFKNFTSSIAQEARSSHIPLSPGMPIPGRYPSTWAKTRMHAGVGHCTGIKRYISTFEKDPVRSCTESQPISLLDTSAENAARVSVYQKTA